MIQCEYCGKINKNRSTQQNRAYFGLVVNLIADHLGYDKEDMHKILAYKFLGTVDVCIDEQVIKVPRSTKKLTTKEFCTYAENIQRWASEYLSLNIPSPNEHPMEA